MPWCFVELNAIWLLIFSGQDWVKLARIWRYIYEVLQLSYLLLIEQLNFIGQEKVCNLSIEQSSHASIMLIHFTVLAFILAVVVCWYLIVNRFE